MATPGASNSQEDADIDMPPMPSEDWEMFIFLKEVADSLTDEDLKTMKFYLSGFGGSGRKVMESIKDPIDYFLHLQHRCLLNRNNLLFLQSVIWHLRRRDLHEKIVEFSKRRGNVLHFYNTEDKPVNGYDHLHFHVAGQEKMNRQRLEDLRSRVSRYLCIPPEFIVNTDIKLTNSIMVTFMIPEGYSNILLNMDDTEKGYFATMGIDEFIINGNKIKCTVSGESEEDCITMESEIKLLLDQKTKAEKEIEVLQVRLLGQDKVIRKMHSDMLKMKQVTDWKKFEVASALVQQFVETKYTPKKFSLQEIALRNARRYFSHSLKKAEKHGYDPNLIRHIIESNTLFTRIQFRSFHDSMVAQQHEQLIRLQQDITSVCYQRDKLAYYLRCGISKPVLTQNEEFFLKVLGLPLPFPADVPGIRIRTGQHDDFDLQFCSELIRKMFTLMDKFENSLTEGEKDAIKKKFVGSSMKAFKDSKLTLLRYIWEKEVQTKGQTKANISGMMVGILSHIRRYDMIGTWLNEFSPQKISTEKERRPSGKQQDQPSHQFDKAKQSSANKPKEKRIEDIDERLARIEDMLEKNLTSSSRKESRGFFDISAPFRGSNPFVNTKLDTEPAYDWSKLTQSKLFGGK